MPIPVVGGFGVMNADAELNDARQSLFSEVILRYGHLLGREEYRILSHRSRSGVRILLKFTDLQRIYTLFSQV